MRAKGAIMNKMPRRKTDRKLVVDHAVLLISGYTESQNLNLPKLGSIREIQHRAETMTPVLREILDFRPSPHW
jgi:hypothetical protein